MHSSNQKASVARIESMQTRAPGAEVLKAWRVCPCKPWQGLGLFLEMKWKAESLSERSALL